MVKSYWYRVEVFVMFGIKIEYIIAILIVFTVIIAYVLIKKIQSDSIKNDLKEINIRYMDLSTVPLAFKLNKATYIAKINEETAQKVEEYREKYDTCQRNLEQLKALIDGIEDNIAVRNNKQARDSILVVKENLKDSEIEVKEIETFLDSITQREQIQREYSNQLKEEYRDLKQRVNLKINEIALAFDGIDAQLKNCEDLFSSFEEQIYANEFALAQEDLEKISVSLKTIEDCVEEVPSLIRLSKGLIPTLMDEVMHVYQETTQTGAYIKHLKIEEHLQNAKTVLDTCIKNIAQARISGVQETLENIAEDLNQLLKDLENEKQAYKATKQFAEKIYASIESFEKTYDYVNQVYKQDKEKYGLENLEYILNELDGSAEVYKQRYNAIVETLRSSLKPSSKLLEESDALFSDVESKEHQMLEYKHLIDKASNDENHATTQVVKLQIVLNEVEVKIAQYRLPAISESYKDDLNKGRVLVKEVKDLLAGIPLDIESLNAKLKEAIDFIYQLYNNVNNVVGMALMVENAIVFGNKYRSTYPELDSELSKAEFAYMNGEYTQSLTIAIASIEKLFPKNCDEKLMGTIKSE